MEFAKKNFPKVAYYMAYYPASTSIFQTVKSMTKLRMKAYNPHEEEGKYVMEQECKTIGEANAQKDNIEEFFLGSTKDFNKKDEVKKILANRTIRGLMKKYRDKLVDKLTEDGNVMCFLGKLSIYVSWDISEE